MNPEEIAEPPTKRLKETHEEIKEEKPLTGMDALSVTASQLNPITEPLSTSSYHQLFANFESNAAIAASVIAAAAAASNNDTHDAANIHRLPTEILKRELMNQKVRADNRERKKRWRQQNEERNKDNDLRCRVNKRAHKLFGKEDSEHKRRWIEEEFLKRQQKRKEKERRKGLVDDTLGAGGNMDLSSLNHPIHPSQSSSASSTSTLQSMTDANYLTLLCNNLGIPAAARTLIGTATNPPPDIMDKEKIQQPFPYQLLEILQQLQQYQPPSTSTATTTSTTAATTTATTPATESTDFNLSNPSFGLEEDAKPEEKLAALLTSTLQAAAAASSSSSNTTKEDEPKTDSEQPVEGEGESEQQQQQHTEFPMDAVLTLMQLNAGWRQ
ncbi:hypothetical protein BDB01DRAFT_852629 [Pilobolus umbonatus]|nr:hypothetical protein BDB01DRAFT_852629 [Pilobolus umbonatus]